MDIGRINIETSENIEAAVEKIPHFVEKALSGEQVYHITNKINNYYNQDQYSTFYAHLQNKGINFITPQFNEKYDNDAQEYLQKAYRKFQFIIPGVEYLGDNYYIIPKDKLSILEEIIDLQTEVLPAGQKFSSVISKSNNATIGYIEINGEERTAYMGSDGRVVVNKPYKSHDK